MKIRKAVGAVVFQNDEYLLVHKVKSINGKTNIAGHWDFPNGHIYDKQETMMFYVEYLGDRRDLKSQDEEIHIVKFFSKYELMRIMDLEETCEFLNEVW